MLYLLNKSIENLASLRHFYDVQKKYIDQKAKNGTKENRMGFLMDYYFNVKVNGTDEEKKRTTFINLEKALEKHITIQEITDKGIKYEIRDKKNPLPFTDVYNASKEYQKYLEMPIIHGNNTLIMLITRFEEFISEFIEIIYKKYPQKYLDDQKIAFSEIANSNVESIREKIISREIEAVMRENYSAWFKLFEEHKFNFDSCNKEYEVLKELYARRNILVHNSGYVNESYIKSVTQTQYVCGDRLYADEEYLINAFNSIKTIIFCIFIQGVRLEKEDKNTHIDNIFSVAFDELCSRNYATCETVFYSLYNCPFVDEKIKYMAKVNYWIAKINNSGLDSVKEEIMNLDVSALDKIFFLAKHILLCEYGKAVCYIEELYAKNELAFCDLEEWPLFEKFRKTEFYDSFKTKHPELSGVVALGTKPDNPMKNTEIRKSVKTELNDYSHKKQRSKK